MAKKKRKSSDIDILASEIVAEATKETFDVAKARQISIPRLARALKCSHETARKLMTALQIKPTARHKKGRYHKCEESFTKGDAKERWTERALGLG